MFYLFLINTYTNRCYMVHTTIIDFEYTIVSINYIITLILMNLSFRAYSTSILYYVLSSYLYLHGYTYNDYIF